jgi:putative lipoic acid-binding regulatory protein
MDTKEKERGFEFPCSYPLKVMGKNTNEFYSAVIAIIERCLPEGSEIAYSSRTSNGDKYLSLTATFTMESRDQLDAIYKELKGHHLVLMTL